MSAEKRKFYVTKPELSPEMIAGIPTTRDGKHLELFYNLIFDNVGFSLPDHLRPIVWALGDGNIKDLMVIISPGSGKSQLVGIGYPLWELGLDSTLTILGVSGGADLMMKWLASSMDIIEHSEMFNTLFPAVKPDREKGWSKTAAFVTREVKGQANPSYEALGYACYDSKTEVLTKRGWLYWPEVIESDIFATRNCETKEFEWQQAKEVFEYNYNGEMKHFKGISLDIFVTPNHNMLINSMHKYSKDKLVMASDVEKYPYDSVKIPVTSNLYRSFHIETENYTGKVYCASVPNETLYVRRNGKMSWCGNSKKIVGAHARLLIIDDLHDDENSSSSDQIEAVEEFYYKTLIGRKDPRGSRMVMIGRRWAADDLYGRLKDSGDWLVMTLANFRDTPELYFDARIPAKLSCVFNDFTPKDVVEDIRIVYGENHDIPGFFWTGELGKEKFKEAIQIKRNKPAIFETVYQSNPESASTKIFNKEDFRDFVIPDAMSLGRNYDLVSDYMADLEIDWLVQSWDTAITSENQNDPSVSYTIGLKGCTLNHRSQEPSPPEIPFHYDLYVFDERYLRMNLGDLKIEVVDYYNMWRPNYVLVDQSLPGIPIIDHLKSESIQVIGIKVAHVSKRNKATNGAKAGSAQGWARQGNILIPKRSMTGVELEWSKDLLNELDGFTGAKGKRDDRVDAIIQAANFAIDFGTQSQELPEGWKTNKDLDERLKGWTQPADPLSRLIGSFSSKLESTNPYYGMCGSCRFLKNGNQCTLHNLQVPKIGTCGYYDEKQEEKKN